MAETCGCRPVHRACPPIWVMSRCDVARPRKSPSWSITASASATRAVQAGCQCLHRAPASASSVSLTPARESCMPVAATTRAHASTKALAVLVGPPQPHRRDSGAFWGYSSPLATPTACMHWTTTSWLQVPTPAQPGTRWRSPRPAPWLRSAAPTWAWRLRPPVMQQYGLAVARAWSRQRMRQSQVQSGPAWRQRRA